MSRDGQEARVMTCIKGGDSLETVREEDGEEEGESLGTCVV